MGLNWNEIKSRALLFSKTWADACTKYADALLVDLYDLLTMPPALLKAHQKLDYAVDAAYQPSCDKKSYASDAERVVFLFELDQRIPSLVPVPATESARKKIYEKI